MNKVFHFGSTIKAVSEDEKELIIEGMASTDDKDRVGDVIDPLAWKGSLTNYKANPVILFNHNYDRPIGRAKKVTQTPTGLQLEAKISKAAGDIVELIKDGVLGAFSVGFMIKDADYDQESDTFIIKKAELLEVSVVSVPANQAATFSVKKSFDSEEEYKDYVNQFKSVDTQASGHELAIESNDALASETPEGPSAAEMEKEMDEKEIQKLIADAMEKARKDTLAAVAMDRAEEKAREEKAAKEAEEKAAKEQADSERVAAMVKSGAEALMEDVEKRLLDKEESFESVLQDLRGELAAKSEEIQKMRESRGFFTDRSSGDFFKDNEEKLVEAKLLGVMTKKGWNTSLGKDLLEKATNPNTGVQAPESTEENFETIVSTAIERDIELELVLANMFRTIEMNAASLVIPTMPDAGYAEFLTGNAAGSGATGPFQGNLEGRDAGSPNEGIKMGSKVLTVEKLVSKSYIADETEEDAIIPILPLIRESMVRAHSRAVEHSVLLGGSGNDLISSQYNGLYKIAVDDSKTVGSTSPSTTALTAAMLLDCRQAMAKYGRRPGDVVYVVSLDGYYDLLDDPEFQDANLVGSDRATKIRGEIGQVYGSPVIVCDEFPAGRTAGNPAAIAVNAMHFVMPILRGVRVEQDRDVENQRQVLVATQRRGFDQIFTTPGQVVAYRW